MDSTPGQAEHLQRQLQDFILMIANADLEKAKAMDAKPEITDWLSELFHLVALLISGKPERRWMADNQHPGFLVSTDHRGTMVAPFHLVADLPSGDQLDDIRAIATGLRLGTGSALCLSGSIVLLGDPRYVGDLDFCEYIPLSERGASLDRLAAIANHTGTPPICVTIKLGATWRLARPWAQTIAPEDLSAVLGPCAEGGHGKIDVVALENTTGPIEATNLMVWVPDAEPDEYAAAYSFPFQEMDPGTGLAVPWVPRQLARPSSIRNYVHFLRGDIDRYRSEKPVKALKRALSLATFLMLHEHQQKLIALGHATGAFAAEAITRRRELVGGIARHPAPEIAALAGPFRLALATWMDGVVVDRHKLRTKMLSKTVGVLIDDLLGAIDAIGRRV